MRTKTIRHFKQNWRAGLTVSLVSIPLALALTIASGGNPTQGIITAFAAGFIAALLGGSQFNITGPTGALSGILISYTLMYGANALPFIAILSGVFIFISYLFRLEKYIIFIPRSVVNGFILGVAFIIAFGQIDNIFGLSNLPKEANILVNTFHSLKNIPQTQIAVFILFALSTIFIIIWNKRIKKIPGEIVIAALGVLLVAALQHFDSSLQFTTLGDKYPSIHGALFVNIFNDFSFDMFLSKDIWFVSMAVALTSILETLLSGQIAENMSKQKFDRRKEVFGLSMANIGSGLLGGIPATAALVRTALNYKSGATSKVSAMINALLIIVIALFFMQYFKLLPMAIIASILICVAIGMVEIEHLKHFWINERFSFFLTLFVAFVTLLEDPIAGIWIGTSISLILFVNKISKGQTELLLFNDNKMTESVLKDEFIKKTEISSDIVVYKITGTLTYVNMPAHLETIKKIKGNKFVVISVRHVFYADTDGVLLLTEIIEILKNQNEKIYLSGINKELEKYIKHEDFYKQKLIEGKVFSRTTEAINSILESGHKNSTT